MIYKFIVCLIDKMGLFEKILTIIVVLLVSFAYFGLFYLFFIFMEIAGKGKKI